MRVPEGQLAQRWCFEMPPIAPRDVHAWINEALGHRSDIGFRNAMSNMILEPRNPFNTRARRKLKAGFVLSAILFAVSLGCFYYFNFAP